MRTPKAYVGAPILQKRFGRYTFRVSRLREVKPIVLGDGWERIHSVLRSPPPFQQRLGRIFPSFQHQMPPMDARSLGTFALPFPRGKIDITIYQHPRAERRSQHEPSAGCASERLTKPGEASCL